MQLQLDNTSPMRFALVVALALAPPALDAQDAGNAAVPSAGGTSTLDRLRAAGRINLGYYAEARPLSFRGTTGDADGYEILRESAWTGTSVYPQTNWPCLR